ncbi:hypothetical protein FRC01_013412 [Tulasnella sp. 417]|nr:hypothetical protein FRC01_013412 [Tulasnella sp. 417]
MDRDEVRSLARKFIEASKRASLFAHDPPSSTMVVIKYFDNIYYFREGKEGSSTSAYGEALYMATCLRMHNEESYEGLDYIEREVRRRAFWLLFGADKSICAISHRPCSLRLEDCTVRLPTEVDDEYITARAILPQPPNKTPLISGFNFISRVFSLIAEIISIVRRDVHKPPSDATAVARLEEVCEIHRRILNAFNDVPPELRLRNTSARRAALGHGTGSQPAFPLLDLDAGGFAADFDGAGFTQAAIAEVNQLFDNPNANREDAGNAFLVMQANIYVTQHMARLMAEQHRHQLVASLRTAGYDLSLVHSPVVAAEIARGGWTADDREAVARDLLQVLHTIPILSIATNGPSLVHKVRFVASTLLDSIREADTAPKPAARALNYLWDFLAILSEIERNYSLGEEIPPPQTLDASSL